MKFKLQSEIDKKEVSTCKAQRNAECRCLRFCVGVRKTA